MKDEFFAFTVTGFGAVFLAGMLSAAFLGSVLKHDWEVASILLVLMLLALSAARSDARAQIKPGVYRGRMFHRHETETDIAWSRKSEEPETTIQ